MIWYILTAVGLTPGGSSTVHIYTQTIHRTTQSTQWHDVHSRLRLFARYEYVIWNLGLPSHEHRGKGRVIPLQARCGPEGSRRFRLPDFHDIWHMKVVRSSAPRTGRLYPQECSWYSFSLGAESTLGPWCVRKENMSLKNPVTPPGIVPGTARLVAQRLNRYTTPGPLNTEVHFDIYFWDCMGVVL
jgi:hypothetical protein